MDEKLEQRLRLFEKKVLRRIFEPKGDKITGGLRKLLMKNFIICTLHLILLV
jgi:hypothetical protein